MKSIIKVSVIFAVTGSLKSYDLIKVLTEGGPGLNTTEVPSLLLYRLMFKANALGKGSAVAVILIVLCFVFALLISLAFKGDDIV